MRINVPLWRQNIGRMTKRHWQIYGKKRVQDGRVVENLVRCGLPVFDANEFAAGKHIETPRITDAMRPQPRSDPDWKDAPCHTMTNGDVLLEGLPQALSLTKTVHIAEKLPDAVEELAQQEAPETIHYLVRKGLMTANVFDCEQKKLPRFVDPERPAHVFPRPYGITDVRRNFLTSNILMNILERFSNDVSKDKYLSTDLNITACFKREKDLIKLQTRSNAFLSSSRPLRPVNADVGITEGIELPNLHPIKHTISLTKTNIYKFIDTYPLIPTAMKAYCPHTTYIHCNSSEVLNLYEKPVTENQKRGRALLHAFTVATAYAKAVYKENIGLLPKPVTIQCVQSDGKNFYFGVLQLNTLNLDGIDGIKNIWYSLPTMQIFDKCEYISAMPILEGYNKDVFKYLNAFYKNH